MQSTKYLFNGSKMLDVNQEFDVQKMPEFKVEKNKLWVIWGYESGWKDATEKNWNNLQPNYYDWLYNSSSKHRAILNTKSFFISGKGLRGTNMNALTLEEKVELNAFLFKLDNKEFVRNITKDWVRYGGFCYEVVFDKGGKKLEPHHTQFGDVRRSVPTYTDGKLDKPTYYFTRDWDTQKPMSNEDWTEFKEFDGVVDKASRYLVYYSDEPDQLYPFPEYTAAVPYIAADYEVGNFVYNNTKNGFNGSYLIEFFDGEPTEGDKAQIAGDVKDTFQGSDNGGAPLVVFNEAGDEGVRVTPLGANGQDDRYINLNQQIRTEIFIGHTISPIIVGVSDGDESLNNNKDIQRTAREIFQEDYVDSKQMVIERHINTLLNFNEIKGFAEIIRKNPLKDVITETELSEVLTINERRERAGYDAVEDGDVLSSSQSTNVFFGSDEDKIILDHFEKTGINDEELEFIASKEIEAFSIEEAESQAEEFKFATILERTILNLIKGGKSLQEIADVTKVPLATIEEHAAVMEANGLLSDGEVTTEGQDELNENEIFTVYKYVERRDALPAKTGSRPFCVRMTALSSFRSWTIEQIRRLRNDQGTDVFTTRGGWYRLPGRDVSRKSCRHVFEARLVRRKDLS